MRRFGPVLKSRVCDNLMCQVQVKVSDPSLGYTPQTVVTYDGSTLAFTYCSNRCVNADYERSSEMAEDESHYWAHVMATYEDVERMEGAHMAAFIEDAEREQAKCAARLVQVLITTRTGGEIKGDPMPRDEAVTVLNDMFDVEDWSWASNIQVTDNGKFTISIVEASH